MRAQDITGFIHVHMYIVMYMSIYCGIFLHSQLIDLQTNMLIYYSNYYGMGLTFVIIGFANWPSLVPGLHPL